MKKKIAALALVVVLLAAAVVGGTMAYFTDTDSATNVFTVGNVDIVLDEAAVSYEDGKWVSGTERVQSNTYEKVYPGAVIPKDPTVHNVGSNSAYVRVNVSVENALMFLPSYSSESTLEDYIDSFNRFVGGIGDGWELTDDFDSNDLWGSLNGNLSVDFTFTYTEPLEAGESTTPLFKEINILTEFDNESIRIFTGNNGEGFKVDLVAEAIQADGFADYTAAFAAFDAQNP